MTSRSLRSTADLTVAPTRRRSAKEASGRASVTSSSAAMIVSGVRSSVRRTGNEAALPLEGGGEPVEHRIEGVGEPGELVVRAVDVDAFIEVRRREPLRGVGDACEGPQDASGHEPTDDERRDGEDAERDRGLDEQLMQRRAANLGGERRQE